MKEIDKTLLKKNIESIASYDLSRNKVFGSAYLVFQNNETVYKNSFGYTNLSKKTPVGEKTLFRLASMTKPITAVAALILVERGLIDLYDTVEKYLPEFSDIKIISPDSNGNFTVISEPSKKVRIINLLNHTSGIGTNPEKMQLMTDNDRKSTDNFLSFLLKHGLDFEPETRQAYSGTGAFQVLVKIIEKVTKTDYQTFLKEEIFKPLDMNDTDFIPNETQWKEFISLHNQRNGENIEEVTEKNCIFRNFPCTHCLGGAGLFSNLEDYSKFAKFLLNDGKIGDKQLIKPETLRLMRTPQVSENIMGGNERWGLGVRVITSPDYGNLPVGTYGWSGAFGSHFWIDIENKIAAVFMKNSLFDGGSANESARNFEKAVNDSLITQ